MEFLVGVTLALVVSIFATVAGLDRDRGFYPVVLIVIALLYDLFAAMAGSVPALGLDTLAMVAFVVAAVVGFKTSLWLVVAALVGHGLFDYVHSYLITNPGVPAWYPNFCLGYDVMAAFYLGWLLTRRPAIRSPEGRPCDGALA